MPVVANIDGGDAADAADAPPPPQPETPETRPMSLLSDEVEYILLLGIDRSKYQMGRTDAILIAAFDHASDQIGIVSVPRDLWVDVPDLYPNRINAVVRMGELRIDAGAGLPLLRKVIHNELGIQIDHTITADFEGFINIIDFLEGIPVDVQCPIEDCFHSDAVDAGCVPLVLSQGEHVLNGATALMFARSRHGRTDIDRARRQQAVLAGLKARLTRAAIIPKLPRLWKKLNHYINTDLDLGAAIRLGLRLATADRSSLHGLVLGTPIIEDAVTEDGKRVFLLDKQKARAAIANIFSSPPPGKRRRGAICPPPDVGLHWRARLKRNSSTR
jgi:LCP family protein required for cell wall assembly